MKLSKSQRDGLRMKYGGLCAYCGCELSGRWHADHVEPVQRDTRYCYKTQRYIQTGNVLAPERDCLENLKPACASCNLDKSTQSLEDWRGWLQDRLVQSMRNNLPSLRNAERFGLIIIPEKQPLLFWFEKYEAEDKAAA